MVEIQAKQWPSSWRELRKLLDRTKDFSLIVSTDEEAGKETLYDLLTVRNDIDRTRAFYKVNRTTLSGLKDLASTAGSALLYFNIQPRDAGKIIWSHNTDTWELLNKAVHGKDNVNLLYYISHRRPAKTQASLRIRAVSPEPSLFAHMNLAQLDGCVCTFEE